MNWKETLRSLPRRTWFRVLVGVAAFLLLVVLVCTLIVRISAFPLQTTREELASDGTRFDCILVPGARVHPDGTLYPVLQDRMDVGLSLLLDGYAETLLLSGDSEDPDAYDEVGAMAVYAEAAGAAETQILQDPLGLSTYESLWRAKYVYHAESVLIVTQSLFLPRALYLADRLGLQCKGVAAELWVYGIRNYLREPIARVKAVWDGIFLPDPTEGG